MKVCAKINDAQTAQTVKVRAIINDAQTAQTVTVCASEALRCAGMTSVRDGVRGRAVRREGTEGPFLRYGAARSGGRPV